MVIVPASKESEAGVLPDAKILGDMGKFNEERVKAGGMLAGEGLHASSKGARIKYSDGKTPVDPTSEHRAKEEQLRGMVARSAARAWACGVRARTRLRRPPRSTSCSRVCPSWTSFNRAADLCRR